ncbi:MAG TPA: zinc-binding alcohol dehydrogenase family protein [Chitinophagaceae bacterium]|nr:zinc-binding alcohol dehydrogenase family protein [Chitinophagaceae bacterium]
MQALVCKQPGILDYCERDKPLLQPGHALIRIRNICICGTDLHAFEGTQPYFQYPRILGHELSGELVAVSGAPDFTIGERVTFLPYINCGTCIACRRGNENCCVQLQVCGVHIDGGFVEYISVPSRLLVHGEGLSFRELALVEPLAIGAHGIARAQVQPGEFVLVIGAGPIGLGAMEFARVAGAQVIAIDVAEHRLTFSKTHIQVPYTINASNSNALEQVRSITGGDMPTVVIDATGNQAAINQGLQYVAHGGRYVLIGLQKGDLVFPHPEFHKRETTLLSSRNAKRADFEQVISSIKSGLIKPGAYINNVVKFGEVKDRFASWLDPKAGVIKTVVEID